MMCIDQLLIGAQHCPNSFPMYLYGSFHINSPNSIMKLSESKLPWSISEECGENMGIKGLNIYPASHPGENWGTY